MREVGAYEAKTRLPELLKQVERGERIVITRHGHPIAQLVPIDGVPAMTAEEAVDAMLEFRKHHTLGPGLSIREMIEEGRL
jgi:prevent-host-death family protein